MDLILIAQAGSENKWMELGIWLAGGRLSVGGEGTSENSSFLRRELTRKDKGLDRQFVTVHRLELYGRNSSALAQFDHPNSLSDQCPMRRKLRQTNEINETKGG